VQVFFATANETSVSWQYICMHVNVCIMYKYAYVKQVQELISVQ